MCNKAGECLHFLNLFPNFVITENGPLPKIEELERKIDIMLVNFNNAISKPRPHMPNQINVGGAHIKSNPKPLPTDIQTFMDGAEHGVIYMSLGAYVQSSLMPVEKMHEFLNAFGKLKQRVLWKFESDNIPTLPKNVMIKKWLPQADILAHKNVRLFITHGGMFGTTEGTYNGIPMLFIPFYGDQVNGFFIKKRSNRFEIMSFVISEKSTEQ